MSVAFDARWQLRFGGLPASAVRELAEASHRESYRAFWCASRHLAASKDAVSDSLHELIAHRIAQGADASSLIALRRALFKHDADTVSRRLGAATDDERAEIMLKLDEHAAPVIAWLDHERLHREQFEQMLAGQRTRLWDQVTQVGFLPGLAIATPDLVSEVERYGCELVARGRVDRRGKRVERSLMSYVTRAAAKTTPFSSLGPVSFPNALAESANGGGSLARSRWSVYPLAHVLSVILERADLAAGAVLRRSPYVRNEDATALVARTTWTFSEVDTRDDYASCVESRVQLPADGVVAVMDDLLDSLGGQATWGILTDQLVRVTDLDHERASDLVVSMVRLGVLVAPRLTIDAFDPDTLETTLAQIAAGGPRGDELAIALRRYRDAAAGVVDIPDAQERAAQVRALRAQVAHIYSIADIAAEPPRSVVYEDIVIDAHDPGLTARLAASLSDVDVLLDFIDLFDTTHIKRDLLGGYYRHLVDAGERVDDVATFLRGFEADLLESFEGYSLADIPDEDLETDPWLRWGGAWHREAARRELLATLSGHQRTLALAGLDVSAALATDAVALDDDVRRIAGTTSRISAPFRHVNLLVQIDAATGVTVLNDCFGGVGFHVSRFSHVIAESALELTDDVERVAADAGVRLLEISGGTVFSNLNLHGPVLKERLQVPGDPVRNSGSGIRLEDLTVLWSDEHERVVLVERVSGLIVHPEYAGYLVPAATPRMHQCLALLTPSANLNSKPADLLRAVSDTGTVTIRPRLTVGGIVVVRAAALLQAADLPSEDPLTRAGNIVWQRFWARHALPQRGYLRVLKDASGGRAKPFFLDVTLVLCLANLHSQLRNADERTVVEITEVLPDPESAVVFGDGLPRVAEAMAGLSIIDRPIGQESA